MNFDQQEKQMRKKRQNAMFRMENDWMQDIQNIAESTEDTLSRTIRYLVRLGIKVHKAKFSDFTTKEEDKEETEA